MTTRSSFGFVLGALLTVVPAAARAQSVGRMIGYDVLHAGGDIVGTWAAPFHSTARDWLGAGAVLPLSAAVSPLDDDIDRWFMDHQKDGVFSSLKEFREGGHAFAGSTIWRCSYSITESPRTVRDMPSIIRPLGAIHCSSIVRPLAGFDCRQQPAIHDSC